MAGYSDSNVLFNRLQHEFNNDNEQEMRYILRDEFDAFQNEAFSIALTIATKARFIFKTNRKSITEVTLSELQEWIKNKRHLVPTQRNQDDAMFFLVAYGNSYLELLAEVFQLDRGSDRGFLAKHVLQYLIHTKNELKDAALIAARLNLQEYIPPTELLLPLFVADKFQVAEAYLKDNPKEQKRYADMLNSLCGMSEESLLQYIQSDLQLRIIDRTKLKSKTLQKISEKVVKKYHLDPANYPNIFREKNLKSLKHLLVCKYRSPEYESEKWDGLIEAAVSDNEWLQEQLMFMLTYQYRDLECAVQLVRKSNVPVSKLPPTLQRELKRTPVTSYQSKPKPKAPSRFLDSHFDDDDNDDGFMFASDDVDLDANDYDDDSNDFMDSVKIKEAPSRFWDYPLPKENIKFVNTCDDLEKSMNIIFKHGNIIGFDGEWQPKYGRAGQRDKMAIMQLAVKEMVFIIDILEFEKTQVGQNLLRKLFKLLFTSESTVRLGYGIDSDISVITNTYDYTNEFFKKSKNFDDLAYISKQIMNSPKVIEKFKLDSTPHQNDRGLSQLVKQCLGKPLDKTYQVSNWEQRPLSEEQIKYAALDALCLIKIYDVFEDLAAEFHMNVEMNEKDWQDSNYHYHEDVEASSAKENLSGGPVRRPGELAVVCDTMLQGLGKALRSCGVDTKILQNDNTHAEAIQLCNEENRIILTKGRPFFQLRSEVPEDMCMCVPDGKTEYQVWTIFQRFNIRATSKDIFSRCQMCNCNQYVELDREKMMIAFWKKKGVKPKQLQLSPFQVSEIVRHNNDPQINYRYVTINRGINLQCEFIPLPVFENVQLFYCCGQCGKVYWEGSHFEKVHKQFARVIDNTGEAWGRVGQSVDDGD